MATYLTTSGIGAGTVLSGGNLTATQTSDFIHYGGARADTLHTTGKWWFEVDLSAMPSGINRAVGVVADASPNYAQIAGNAFHSAVAYLRSGSIWVGGASAGTVDCPVCNGFLMVAVDFDLRKIWFKTRDGQWNDNSASPNDPDAGTGGISVTSVDSILPGFYPVCELNADGVTFNFNNASSYHLTPPSTFTIWGSVPVTPTRHLVAHQGIPRFQQVFTLEVLRSVNLTLAATEPSDTMSLSLSPGNGVTLATTEPSDTFAGEMVSVDLPAHLVDGEIIYVRGEGDIIVPADSIKRGSENQPIQIPEETPVNVIPVTDV